MATYDQRGAATYGGLLQQTYAAIIVGSACLIIVETLRRVPRRRGKGEVARSEPSDNGETRGLAPEDAERVKALGSRENWTNGYLYMGRCWAAIPSPPHPKWPLVWIWQVLRTPDDVFLQLSGVDATVYTRFLRACFYFTALHTCTTLVIILPIHYLLSPPDIKRSDINRGSITTLVSGLADGGEKILWVHMCMVIWITISWLLILTWFVLGSLRYRAFAARHVPAPATSILQSPDQPSSPTASRPINNTSSFPAGAYTSGTLFPLHPEPAPARAPTSDIDGAGPDYSLRCRTVMVTNIPRTLRTPEMLRWYFGRYLPEPPAPGQDKEEGGKSKLKPWKQIRRQTKPEPPLELVKPHDGRLHKHKPPEHKDQQHALSPYTPEAAREFEVNNNKEDQEKIEKRGLMLIENVVIAPKLSGLADMIEKREKMIEELEEGHIALGKAVMARVGKEIGRRGREEGRRVKEGRVRRRMRLREEAQAQEKLGIRGGEEDGGGRMGAVRDWFEGVGWIIERFVWGEPDRSAEMDEMVRVIAPFVEQAKKRDSEYGVRVWARGVVACVKKKMEERRQGKETATGENVNGSEGESPTDGDDNKPRTTLDEGDGRSKRGSEDLKLPTSPTSNGHTSPEATSPENRRTTSIRRTTSPTPQGHVDSAHDTVWSALYSLPASTLRPYHPHIRDRSILFYPLELVGILGTRALPSIDLAFRRIGSLQKRIEEYKSRPLPDTSERKVHKSTFSPLEERDEGLPDGDMPELPTTSPGTTHAIESASSAFVTFRRWEDARRAARALAHRPGRPLTCLVVMAPQTTDLDWGRLVKGKFAAQFVRDWLVKATIWLFQIFWVFPISIITTLISIKSLETVFHPLTKFFERNPRAESLITGLIPTLLVAGLGILIPVILFAIGRKAQTEVTFSGLHNGILIRYYKWLIMNIVIFFCIGLTGFRAFLEAFKKEIPDPFRLVASSFPAAASFYASWFILQTSLQNMMQLGLVGLPLITYIFGVRKASTPRKRKRGIQPRTIDYHYWTPNHLLAMHIVMIFAVLNPLVIPFGLIYYSVANVVFRNQLLHVYARRFYEGNGKMLTIRIMRYSMDGLVLSHVVFLAFSLLNYSRARAGISGTLLGVTLLLKILATREFRARYERLEDAESARLCGHEEPFLGPSERTSEKGTRQKTSTFTNEPLSRESLNAFQSPAAAMGPSTFSLNHSRLRSLGHKYDLPAIRGHPLRGKPKGKSISLSRLASRTGSQADMLRPDSPASDETGTGAAPQSSSRLLPPPLGLYDLVHQAAQVPTKILGLVVSKDSQISIVEGINYFGGQRPVKLIEPGPTLGRWDDTPNGSASYECPYYLDDGPKALWLPRDPSGPVDLDDTVAMYRLLLSVYNTRGSESLDNKALVNNKASNGISIKNYGQSLAAGRPSVGTNQSEKSIGTIPVTQSPMGTPSETPQHSSSYSSRAARPSMLHMRTASADGAATRSSWGRRQSISEALEMSNLQVPGGHATTPPATSDEPVPQTRVTRQPSLLNIFRPRRSGGEGTDAARPTSVFSFKTAADGGETRAAVDARKSKTVSEDEVRRALEAAVQAEEKKEEERKAREERAERLDDARVEQEETGGWSVLKKLVLKRNTEE
ncbi:hypothetical protein BDV93DRAFT_610707 [Ceratobasidium sp. AG-I]|nr:hypothetical protein BDV93DRAFT_610707 [Ceratobasidium sp. AG-I]